MKILSISRTIDANGGIRASLCWKLAKHLLRKKEFQVLWIAGTSKKWDERKILNEKNENHYLKINYIQNKQDVFDFFTFLPNITMEINKILNAEKKLNLIIFPKEDTLVATALKSVEHKAKIISWSYSEPFEKIIKKIDAEKNE